MEDLLEQLVGDIWDEDEEVENRHRQITKDKFEFSGDCSVSEMLEILRKEPKFIDSESKSVGGWVIEQLGDIPESGAAFTYQDLSVTVNSVEDNRITSVTVTVSPEKSADEIND